MTKRSADLAAGGLLAEFLEHKPVLASQLRRLVTPQEVDDLLQDTFLRSYEAAQRHEIRFPRAFLSKTATNLALKRLGRAERKSTRHMEDLPSSEVSTTDGGPAAALEIDERFQQFCQAVGRLPKQCRRVFILKKVYGFSQKEIAAALAVSESTVEKHIVKGLLLCREYLRSALVEPSES